MPCRLSTGGGYRPEISFPLFSSDVFASTSFFQVEVVLVLMWYAWENVILCHCFMGRNDLLYVVREL